MTKTEVWLQQPIVTDGTFDFLNYSEWLQECPLEALHTSLLWCKEMELKHVRCCYLLAEQGNLEQHKSKVRFYVKMAQDIEREIAIRRYPGLRPFHEN